MYFRETRNNLGLSNRATYVIDNAQPKDTGTYSCVAQNSAGSVEERLQLIVSEVNEIPGGETSIPNEEDNKTSGPNRGDIPGGDDSNRVVLNTKSEDDLVNVVGSRAVFTCNTGMYGQQLTSQ